MTEQARKGVVHSVCLSESQSHVENGLDQHLFERQSAAMQMQEVRRDGRWLVEDCSGKLVGKDACRVGERKRLGPRQRVRLTLVKSWGGECIDGNVGDIPNVDESGSASAGWHEEAVVVNDIVQVGIAQVLSKEPGSDNGPSFWAKPKVLLDRAVRNKRVVRGTCDGDEYDLPHSFSPCDVEERVQGGAGVGNGGRTKQENGIAASHGVAEGARIEEIERSHLDLVQWTNQARLPRADAKPDMASAQARHDR